MITLLTGENSFEIERTLNKEVASFEGEVERLDGELIQISQLPDLLMGVSLFATKRLVVISDLSANKSVWSVFGNWINKVSDDIGLFLIDAKPDKRSSTYKLLKDKALVKEFAVWSDRDFAKAEKWVADESRAKNLGIDQQSIRFLVQWVGVDQWQLFHAIEKLSLLESVNIDLIKEVVDPNPNENVFNLLSDALEGDVKSIRRAMQIFEQSEDVYKLLGLLSAQVFQLAAIVNANSDDNVSKDFGINPYVVAKLRPIAKKLGKNNVAKLVGIFADADSNVKTSTASPWLIVETALIKASCLTV
jgi:DNA polymerase III delta subunit